MRKTIYDIISTYIGKNGLLIIRNLLKAVIFVYVGLSIFLLLQIIFMQKWYFPPENTNGSQETRIVSGFYAEEKNSIDVVLLGTSHLVCGVYPMEIYQSYGVTVYNLATSGQPIEVSMYLLEEVLKTQNVKVIVLDVSSLFLTSDDKVLEWRCVLDSMPLSVNKIELANEFMKVNNSGNVYDKLFPLICYHNRWKDLQKRDFVDFSRNRHLYSKGGNINSIMSNFGIDIDTMNRTVEELKEQSERYEVEYTNETYLEMQTYSSLYETNIPEKNIFILRRIKQLCDERGVKLLLTKIPAVNYPNYYPSSWTFQRSETIKNLCSKYNINFFDIVYDSDTYIDGYADSLDDGRHLSYKGAVKVSSVLGRYLKEHYNLEENRLDQWDKDLETYKKVKRVAELQTETDFVRYLTRIANDYRDKTVYIVASDDMSAGLSDEDVIALRNLGLKTDYSGMYRNGYIAVIKDEHIQYETYSNQYSEYHDQLQNGTIANLYSRGWYCGSDASIIINDVDYSMKGRGLNIVVYDEQLDMVWDSVCFDTCAENHTGYRNPDNTLYYLQQYENYLIEVEDR